MAEELKIKLSTTSVAGTDDYNLLFNHPKINGVEVAGEKSLDDYDIKKKSEANAEHTEINAAISSETDRAEAAEKANADATTQEVADRKAADSVLNDAINAETTRAQAAEKFNSDALTQEVSDRKSADSALTDSIQAETERAQSAENANSDAIVKEVTDRTTAISNHISDNSNPHKVTKAQVGLGNVDNTADADKDVKHAADSTTVNGHTVNSNVPASAKFTDTTYSAFTGATSYADGSMGLVPKPAIEDAAKYLCGDGTWKAVSGGTGTSDAPVQVSGTVNSGAVKNGKIIAYLIGHLLHVTAKIESVKFTSGLPLVAVFTIPRIDGFTFGSPGYNVVSTWVSADVSGTTTNKCGLVSAELDGIDLGIVVINNINGETIQNVNFSIVIPLFDD